MCLYNVYISLLIIIKLSISVPSHFKYHDVDQAFLAGMMEQMEYEFSGSVEVPIPDSMTYPLQILYGPLDKHLSSDVKQLQLKSTLDWKAVQTFLKPFDCVQVLTEKDFNCAIQAVCIQLHVPKELTSQKM